MIVFGRWNEVIVLCCFFEYKFKFKECVRVNMVLYEKLEILVYWGYVVNIVVGSVYVLDKY